MTTPKKPRGRNGGRKPSIPESVSIQIRVSHEQLSWLDATGNRSEAIRQLIDGKIKKTTLCP